MFQTSGNPTGEGMLAVADITIIPLSYAEPPFPTIGGCNGTAKRLLDVVACLVLLALAGVPMLVIALLIRFDSPGPILFRQRRIGYGNLAFETLKFRTMHHHAPRSGRLRQARQHDPA